MTATNSNAINYFSPARWVVSKVAGEGTHTTIGAALAASAAGDTIYVMEGTYTEDNIITQSNQLVSTSGGIVAGGATIIGKFTNTGAYTLKMTGLSLQTNSDYCLKITGSAASAFQCFNCNIIALNSIAIFNSSSSANSTIQFNNCTGGTPTSSIGFFSWSSPGSINFQNSFMSSSGGATAISTLSAGLLNIYGSLFLSPISTSSTSNVLLFNNVELGILSIGGSGINYLFNSYIAGGTASAITVGSGAALSCNLCQIYSSNTDAITGTGTFNYGGVTFLAGSSTLINTTTSVPEAWPVIQGGTGLTSTTANQLLYSSATNTIAGLATANNGILITSASGVPSILADGTTGQVLTATTGSPPAWAAAPSGNLIISATTTITNVQLKAGSSVTVVAAPGAGICNIPISMALKLVYGGNNAFSNDPSYSLSYGATASALITIAAATGFSEATQNVYTYQTASATTAVAHALIENAVLTFAPNTGLTGNAAANNTIEVSIAYYQVTM